MEKSISCVADSSSTACLIAIIFSRALHQHTQLWIFIHKYYWEDLLTIPYMWPLWSGMRWKYSNRISHNLGLYRFYVRLPTIRISWMECIREVEYKLKKKSRQACEYSHSLYEHVTLLNVNLKNLLCHTIIS